MEGFFRMKKTLMILLVLAMVATAAFAEVTVGGWGRAIPTFGATSYDLDPNDKAVTFTIGPSWAGGTRARFEVNGTSDYIGFQVQVNSNGTNSVQTGDYGADNVNIWVKPFDFLTLTAGKKEIHTLRGKIGAGNPAGWNPFDDGGILKGDFEDHIFSRLHGSGPGQNGLAIELTPVEGAYMAIKLFNDGGDTPVDAGDTFENGRYSAGYMIDGVGHLRFQYQGDAAGDTDWIQAAFAYTGMEGLLVDAGLTYTLDSDVRDPSVALGVTYGMDAITAKFCTDVVFADDMIMQFLVAGAYALDGGVSANLEIAMDATDGSKAVSVYPYVRKGFSNGYTSAGFTFAQVLEDDGFNAWSIPVVMEYWF